MNCRCISVNSQIEHEFPTHLINPQAILIEDINQDNKNELIIGTASGDILIYKGSLASPWLRTTKSIGCITCMAYDSLIEGRPKHLIVHDAIGYLYFFSINQVGSTRRRYASDIGTSTKTLINDYKLELNMFFQTKLLINPKYMLIDDLYNNGSKKLIVGYTDRMVRVYSWNTTSLINNLASSNNNNNSKLSNNSSNTNSSVQEVGKIVFEICWELPDQLYSINIFKDSTNSKCILASISGGRVFICKTFQSADIITDSNSSSASSLSDLVQHNSKITNKSSNYTVEEMINFFAEINSNDMQRSNLPCFLVTNVNFNKCNQYGFLITVSGDIFFFRLALNGIPNKTPIWQRNINAIVMKYYRIDINKDGNEELLIATPEGQVFIISCYGDFLCLDLGEPVRGFHIGLYSTELVVNNNLLETGTRSEIDLCNPSAFEMALDSSPIIPKNEESSSSQASGNGNNTLCFVFWSSITNKINLLQIDTIITYSKLKPASQLKYKCENVFSKSHNFSPRLNEILDSNNGKCLNSDLIHNIIYN